MNAVMAKKQTRPKKAPKPADASLTIRCSPAWREWIEQGAKHCRTDVSKLIDGAVMDYLQAKGFPKPPPER